MESIQTINRDQKLYHPSNNPKIPYKNTVFSDIARISNSYGGIIVGSYALLIFNQNYKGGAKDVDVLTTKPATLSKLVTQKLNEKYGDRFYQKKHVNSYKIYDKQQGIAVADFINYPISKNDYTIVEGLKVAYPGYVFKGRKKRARQRYTGVGIRIPMLKIRRLI